MKQSEIFSGSTKHLNESPHLKVEKYIPAVSWVADKSSLNESPHLKVEK